MWPRRSQSGINYKKCTRPLRNPWIPHAKRSPRNMWPRRSQSGINYKKYTGPLRNPWIPHVTFDLTLFCSI